MKSFSLLIVLATLYASLVSGGSSLASPIPVPDLASPIPVPDAR